jgi:ABC-type multidrug transport system ATPase subunit
MVWLFVVLVNFVGGPFIGRISSVDGTTEGYWSAVMLLPSFALLRSIYYAGAFNSGGQGVVVGSDQFYQGTNLGMCSGEGPFCRSMLFLVVEWIVLMVVGIYLDQVLPSATGVRKHPLFFLGMKRGRGRGDELLTREIDENELEEVAMERALVTDIVANDPKTSEGIVIDGLHKVYEEAKPSVHAVRGLSFVARHGEITGLLGSNGSGKTSAIRCLIGAQEISGGDAYVSGHSIRTNMPEIHRSLGICLQQDIGWDCLSVREHLFFVGRLRNIPKIELKGAVERAMESVGITYAAKRKSGQCSGGMRRRLSVAMALLGDTSTIILDELSSGLDPSNAAIVWQAIKEAKDGKTILLTTHSMEEAQVLCDRLHMVTRGSLRTTGNPEELRLRLGRGYRLAAAVPDTKIGDFHDLMIGILPECRIETSLGGSLQYSIPRDVRLSAIFDTMNVNKERLCIRDWGVSQSSLEDVFLNIVARDEADLGVTKLIPSSESAWL